MFNTHIFCLLPEGHDTEAPRAEAEPGRTAAQEEAWTSAQRTEPGPTQEPTQPQQPPALRPGEQPSAGQDTQQEEEETPAEETPTRESRYISLLMSKYHKR